MQLDAFKKLLEDYSGLEFNSYAEQRLVAAITKQSAYLGIQPTGYLERIRTDATTLAALVNELTINETYFFREPEQIRFFVQTLLPRLRALEPQRPLRILSVGCSSGEEPYSLAMAICEQWGDAMLEQVQIDAGDLDDAVLKKARKAVFAGFSFRALDKRLLNKYFVQNIRVYHLRDKIREQVTFFSLNLKAASYPIAPLFYDVIFFRNVSIYFSRATRIEILTKLKHVMARHAILFVGCSEVSGNDLGVFELEEEQGQYYFTKQRIRTAPEQKTVPAKRRPLVRMALPVRQAPEVEPLSVEAVLDTQLMQIKTLLENPIQHQAALNQLDVILEADTGNTVAMLMKAWVLLNQRQIERAQCLFEAGLKENPWCLDGLIALGLCLKRQGCLAEAVRQFKAACYSHPDSWLAHYYLADLHRELNEPHAARKSFQVVRRILSADIQAVAGSEWLPLMLPARDVLFLTERHLLNLLGIMERTDLGRKL